MSDQDPPYRKELLTLRLEEPEDIAAAGRILAPLYALFLVAIRDGLPERRFRLQKSRTVVGRTGADIEIDDPLLSRKHVAIDVLTSSFVQVCDLASTNGTFVNEVRVDTLRRLSPGDVIRIGGTQLRVVVESIADAR